jgi:hypothetical protein
MLLTLALRARTAVGIQSNSSVLNAWMRESEPTKIADEDSILDLRTSVSTLGS